MTTVLVSRLQRRRFKGWAVLFCRSLATAGLFLAATVAAASHRGLISLGLLTLMAMVAIAVGRAYGATRRIGAAARLHRTVERALDDGLTRHGWHLKHNVAWPEGPGDGHLAMNPSGELAFAIKDCAVAIGDFDLSQTQDFASALSETGRPYVPICVAAAQDARPFANRGVVCCTPELLAAELIEAEQAFATSLRDEAARRELLYSQPSPN